MVQTQRKYRIHKECGNEVSATWGLKGCYDCEHCKVRIHSESTKEVIEKIV